MVMSARLQHGRSFFIGMRSSKSPSLLPHNWRSAFYKRCYHNSPPPGTLSSPDHGRMAALHIKGEHMLWQESFSLLNR